MKKNNQPNWNAVLMEYAGTGRIQKCPSCGGNHVLVEKYYHEHGRYSMWFVCEDCKAGCESYCGASPAEENG